MNTNDRKETEHLDPFALGGHGADSVPNVGLPVGVEDAEREMARLLD